MPHDHMKIDGGLEDRAERVALEHRQPSAAAVRAAESIIQSVVDHNRFTGRTNFYLPSQKALTEKINPEIQPLEDRIAELERERNMYRETLRRCRTRFSSHGVPEPPELSHALNDCGVSN